MELETEVVPSLFPITYAPEQTSATVNGLRPFTAYSCSLTASTVVGPGPPAIDTPMTDPSGKKKRERKNRMKESVYYVFLIELKLQN